ncbi:unnamed protein product [Fraxinus pennsylvanica]|uniref:Uncharacterized protein n=1 Tax=Fraxinus pennsylvanica TaxID=56036 RepID=A0AAD2A9M3_9LAMI|nr:unnamed protein product [Fraxinus pennsylvanica]
MERELITFAISITSSKKIFLLCFIFFCFLAIALKLLECFDDKVNGKWDDYDLSLTVLDSKLDGHVEAILVISYFLGDFFSNFLGREVELSDFGAKRAGFTDLAVGNSDKYVNDLRGIELRRHFYGSWRLVRLKN